MRVGDSMKTTGKRTPSRLAACLVLIATLAGGAVAEKLGRFEGSLVLKALPDGRTMELMQSFAYVDSHDVSWPVPSGARIDGASIPSVFWSIIGAPYTGKYREASVIHDYYCAKKSRHWKAVHKVFLDGMLARGVDTIQAELIYLAVYRFGPRWNFDVDACYCKGCPVCANPSLRHVDEYEPKYNAKDFEALRNKLNEGHLSLQQLEDTADYQLNTEILK